MWGELSAVSELVPSEGEEIHLLCRRVSNNSCRWLPFKEGTQSLPAP